MLCDSPARGMPGGPGIRGQQTIRELREHPYQAPLTLTTHAAANFCNAVKITPRWSAGYRAVSPTRKTLVPATSATTRYAVDFCVWHKPRGGKVGVRLGGVVMANAWAPRSLGHQPGLLVRERARRTDGPLPLERRS